MTTIGNVAMIYLTCAACAIALSVVAVRLGRGVCNAARCQQMVGLARVRSKECFEAKQHYILVDGFMHSVSEPEGYELELEGQDAGGRKVAAFWSVPASVYGRVKAGDLVQVRSGKLKLIGRG